MKRPSAHDILVSIGFVAMLALLAFAGKWVWDTYRNPRAKVDFEKYPVRGIDVSVHNGHVDFNKVRRSGVSFVWIKASEGETHRDTRFSDNFDNATSAGLLTGAYHFFRFDCDGVKQAVNLCEALDYRLPDMGVAIDVELQHNAEGVPDEVIIDNLASMTDYLIMKGLPVIFYTNKEGYNRFIKDDFGDFPLWICSFSDWEPFEDDTQWAFWQYSHRGEVDGVKGDVDENVYTGSFSSLKNLGK